MDPIAQAYREKKEWEKSIGIGTLDKLASILSGEQLDYDAMDYLGGAKPEEHHIDFDGIVKMAGVDLETGKDEIKASESVQFSYSQAHIKAIEKYPSLIEMLGNDDTHELAERVALALNGWIIEKVSHNSKSINENALECKQDGAFIKQYYKYNDRVGYVKVSGKFSGSEYIHYVPKENTAKILVKSGDRKYKEVSERFSIDCQFVEIGEK